MLWALLFSCVHPADLIVSGQLNAVGEPRAIVIRGAQIAAVVPTTRRSRFTGPHTVLLNAPVITAGFIDAHAHPIWMGKTLGELDLSKLHSYKETLEAISAVPGDGLIEGLGWDQTRWTDAPNRWPLAADLERLHPGRAIALRRIDGHALWVSEALLKKSAITDHSPNPPGGRVVRDAEGHASGVLIDAATELITLPSPSRAERTAHAKRTLEALKHTGLTGLHAMGVDDEALSIWAELNGPIRLWLYVDPDSEAAARLKKTGPWFAAERVKVMGVKVYADGALGSRGAWLSAPYSDAPDQRGHPTQSREPLSALAESLLRADAQLAVHAIGDQAVHLTLNAFEQARARTGNVHTRLRVEHAQVVRPADRPRFAALQAVASMQPTHALDDHAWAERRLGPTRVRWAYSWRSLLSANAPLAFGSDLPIASASPHDGLIAATERRSPEGEPALGWYSNERVTLAEAIDAYTRGAAFATHDERRLGQLAVGQLADLSLWTEMNGHLRPIGAVINGELLWSQPSEAIDNAKTER